MLTWRKLQLHGPTWCERKRFASPKFSRIDNMHRERNTSIRDQSDCVLFQEASATKDVKLTLSIQLRIIQAVKENLRKHQQKHNPSQF